MSNCECRLAITAGEPAGVGPDLVVDLAGRSRAEDWIAIADRDLLERAARRLGRKLQIDDNLHNPSRAAHTLTVRHVELASPEQPGLLDPGNAGYVLRTLQIAARGCVVGDYQGVVTGPVQKSILNTGGISFSGHTEFFRDEAAVEDVVMLLIAGSLRVALATTHLALRDVADAITRPLLSRRIKLLLEGLQSRFGIPHPRVLVAGLNPHAGESGLLGREEIDVIGPVCDEARAGGADVLGPLPADTLFTPRLLGTADAVLAMYHDQGLPVLKQQGFGAAVNVTLGLPFVRTSVDHGTALDLAGTGKASVGSFAEAVKCATRMVRDAGAVR